MSNITIKDIARICEVGVGTVSRAINNDPGVSEATKERILKVVREKGYVPNNSARNLKLTDSNTIALMIKGIDNQFFQGMFQIFEEELSENKYSFIINAVGESQDNMDAALQLAKEKKLKGIIFLGGLIDNAEERLKNIGIPCVLCTVAVGKNQKLLNCSAVAVDDEAESYKMTDYLIKKGHRRIAIISGKSYDKAVGKVRLDGYIRALKDNGIEVDKDLICPMIDEIREYSLENGYAVTKKLLESGTDFTAIFAISDLTAIGAYKALYDAGYKVPDDYSVAGFDGLELGKYLIPTLTTIEQPGTDMARASIKLLMDAIDGNDKHVNKYYDAKLLEMDSVKDLTK